MKDIKKVNVNYQKMMDVINKLLKNNGFAVKVQRKDFTGNSVIIDRGTINPKILGKFQIAFKSIDYKIIFRGSTTNDVFRISFDYNYEHLRGSNGHEVSYLYVNDELKLS